MIKLEINSQKELTLTAQSKVYKGENLINSFALTATGNSFGEHRAEDCQLYLHIVMPDNSFIVYPVTWSENSIPKTAFIPITGDITEKAQFLTVFAEINSAGAVIGKTNSVQLQVFDSPIEQTSIVPREQLEQTIGELEEELESASTLTETLEALSGSYDSFPERLAADEADIASNAAAAATQGAAIVSLTSVLNGKLDNLPSSVSCTNLADGSVTLAKIASSAYTSAPTQDSSALLTSGGAYTALQGKTNRVSDTSDTTNLAGLGTYTDHSTVYTLALSLNILYSGQSEGTLVKLINLGNTQIVIDRSGYIYTRDYNVQTSSWSAFSCPLKTLEAAVGTLNTQLENALNGGV